MKLYELADARDAIDRALELSEGELTPELDAALTALDGAFEEKAERVALFVVNELATAKAIKSEEERLAQRRKALEHRADSLKRYLETQLVRVGKRAIRGTLATIAMQTNPPSVVEVVSTDERDFRALWERTPEFVAYTPESFAWNKRAILDAYKAGTLTSSDVARRVAITHSESLRIR
jgi:hypothetical protein